MTVAEASIPIDVVALSSLNDDRYQDLRDAVMQRLGEFDCSRSTHLQNFARGEVHRREAHGHSRTYVMITPEGSEGIDVAAFFTVGMASLDLTKASRSQKNKLSGEFSMDQTGAYSIAELARSDRYSAASLPGPVILRHALSVIESARSLVAGRFVVVDSQRPVFESLYAPAGFKELSVAPSPRGMEDKQFLTSCCVLRD
ncbi:hypothetical protein ACFVWL_10555 [Microbacterium sp. NPDC058269]|uniref:hypothetical protein n=1 Tax=Microbacterium sp. NPDC058269 TaxID=3346414 RepID=UPI0036D84FE4